MYKKTYDYIRILIELEQAEDLEDLGNMQRRALVLTLLGEMALDDLNLVCLNLDITPSFLFNLINIKSRNEYEDSSYIERTAVDMIFTSCRQKIQNMFDRALVDVEIEQRLKDTMLEKRR